MKNKKGRKLRPRSSSKEASAPGRTGARSSAATTPRPAAVTAPGGDFIFSFAGDPLSGVHVPPGLTAARFMTGAGQPAVRLGSGNREAKSTGWTEGFSIRVPDDFERSASGNRVKITVVARAADGTGQARFAAAYSTCDVGNSGWQWFDCGAEWKKHDFEFDVPTMVDGNGDFIGILPSPGGAPDIEVVFVAASILAR
jgi:hypothetical protein